MKITKHTPEPVVVPPVTYTLEVSEAELSALRIMAGTFSDTTFLEAVDDVSSTGSWDTQFPSEGVREVNSFDLFDTLLQAEKEVTK